MKKEKQLSPAQGFLSDEVLEVLIIERCINDTEALSSAMELLEPTDFSLHFNQVIYRELCAYFDTSPLQIDTVNLFQTVQKNPIAGLKDYYIDKYLGVNSSSTEKLQPKIFALKELSLARQLNKASRQIYNDSLDRSKDIFELVDKAERTILKLTDFSSLGNLQHMPQALAEGIKSIEALQKAVGLTGITSGFEPVDDMGSGWQDTDLVIIAARPGMGKTSFTLQAALNAAKAGKKVGFFSLEMATVQLIQKLISIESEVKLKHLRRPGYLTEKDWQALYDAMQVLEGLDITIDDTAGLSLSALKSKCRKLKQTKGLDMVVIDYLQLMTGDTVYQGNREQEISNISRGLKGLAKELNLPVIALSQLSRAVETRGGMKRPTLSDLRESGALEQDADIVIFLYRPAYYKILEDEEGADISKVCEVIYAKHRNGGLGPIKLTFIDVIPKFFTPKNYEKWAA